MRAFLFWACVVAFMVITIVDCEAEEKEACEISIAVGGKLEDKKESKDNRFYTKLSYEDTLHNNYSFSYTIKEQEQGKCQ